MNDPDVRHTTSRAAWSPDGPRMHPTTHHQPHPQWQGPGYRPPQHQDGPSGPPPQARPSPVDHRPPHTRPAAPSAPPADYHAYVASRPTFSGPYSARGRGGRGGRGGRRSFTSPRGRGRGFMNKDREARYRPQASATQATYRPHQALMQANPEVEDAPAPYSGRSAGPPSPPEDPTGDYGQAYHPAFPQRPTSPVFSTYTQRRQSAPPSRHEDVSKYAPAPQPASAPRYPSAPPHGPPQGTEYAQRSQPHATIHDDAEQAGRIYPPPSYPPPAAPQHQARPVDHPLQARPPSASFTKYEQGRYSAMPLAPSAPPRPRQAPSTYHGPAQGYEAVPPYTRVASPEPPPPHQRQQPLPPHHHTRGTPPGRPEHHPPEFYEQDLGSPRVKQAEGRLGVSRFDYATGRGGGYAGRMDMGRGGMHGRGGGRGYGDSNARAYPNVSSPSSTAFPPPSRSYDDQRGPRGADGPPAMSRHVHWLAAPVHDGHASTMHQAEPYRPAEGPAGPIGLSRVKQMLATKLMTAARAGPAHQNEAQGGQRRHRGVVPDLMAQLHGGEESQDEEEERAEGGSGHRHAERRGSVMKGHEVLEDNGEHDLELIVPPRVRHQYEDTVKQMGQRVRDRHRDFPGQASDTMKRRSVDEEEDARSRDVDTLDSERRHRKKKRKHSRRHSEELDVSPTEELVVSPGPEHEYETAKHRDRAKRKEERRKRRKDEKHRHEKKRHKKHRREEDEEKEATESDTEAARLFAEELRAKLMADAAEDPSGLSVAPSPLISRHSESMALDHDIDEMPGERGQVQEALAEEVASLDMEAYGAQETVVTEGDMMIEQQGASLNRALEVSEDATHTSAALNTSLDTAHPEPESYWTVDRQPELVLPGPQPASAMPVTVSTTTTTTFMVRTTHVEKEKEAEKEKEKEHGPTEAPVHKGTKGKTSKLGVKAGGGGPSRANTRVQESKRAPAVDSHRREYYCEACGVEEACNSAYLVHLKSHQDCPVETCDAHGSKAVIDTHFNFVHGKYSSEGYHTVVSSADPSTGPLYFRVLVGHDRQGDRLLDEWLAARRAKFPTSARIRENREKEERMQARLARRDERTRTITVEEVANLHETEVRKARPQWWCEYCEVEFHSDEEFLNHLEGHESCTARGCFLFHALPSVLWTHYDFVHGRYAKGRETDGRVEVVREGATYEICVSEDPAHVDMWLAERTKRYPKKKVELPTADEADVETAQADSDQEMRMEGQATGMGETEDSDDDSI